MFKAPPQMKFFTLKKPKLRENMTKFNAMPQIPLSPRNISMAMPQVVVQSSLRNLMCRDLEQVAHTLL